MMYLNNVVTTALIVGSLGAGCSAGEGSAAPAPGAESAAPAPGEESAAAPVAVAQTPVTWTGDECEATLATYCAPLLTSEWMAWCDTQKASWAAAGVTSINSCANSKYARDACTEATILTRPADVPDTCEGYHWALVSSAQAVNDNCLYTTQMGGVCYGVKAAPVPPGTKPEDVVVPLDDCLKANYATLTPACQSALDLHTLVSKSPIR